MPDIWDIGKEQKKTFPQIIVAILFYSSVLKLPFSCHKNNLKRVPIMDGKTWVLQLQLYFQSKNIVFCVLWNFHCYPIPYCIFSDPFNEIETEEGNCKKILIAKSRLSLVFSCVSDFDTQIALAKDSDLYDCLFLLLNQNSSSPSCESVENNTTV